MIASSARVRLYLTMVFWLCAMMAAFVAVITFIRPVEDNTALIAVMVGLYTPIVVALMGAALKENHDAMNSRLSQLIELQAKASKAEGKLEGP